MQDTNQKDENGQAVCGESVGFGDWEERRGVGKEEEEKDQSRRWIRQSIPLHDSYREVEPYITVKQAHCIPTCAIPKIPATQSNAFNSLQQARSRWLAGKVRIFAKAHVPDVVPRRTKYGEMPSEERREIMR